MTNVDDSFALVIQATIDSKTKPRGALGQIEGLAATIAQIQQTLEPHVETCSLTIFAGDHGMAEAGISAFPQDVTRQMVFNFLEGAAAANVFARSLGADVQVVDAGVAGEPIDHCDLINRRIAPGTQDAIKGCLLYTSPSPRDQRGSRMPSSA